MKLLKLDLGCGINVRDGYLGVDIAHTTKNIIKSDVLQYLKKLPKNSVSHIYSSHYLEHVDKDCLFDLLKEIDRTLVKGGEINFIVPHFSNPYYHSDPTHKTTWGVHSFSYICETSYLARKVPAYAIIKNWQLVKVRIKFISMFKGRLLGVKFPLPSNILNLVLNLHHYLIEVFERYLCYIVPIYEIKYTIIKK